MSPFIIVVVSVVLLLLLAVLWAVGVISRVAFVALALVVAVIGGLIATKIAQFQAMGASRWAPPPSVVTTATVTEDTWEPILSATGSLVAVQGVTISAQLDGNVAQIAFVPGNNVQAGDLLLQQDVTAEEAQLQAAEAGVELTKINLQRSRDLLARATISQQQFDTDEANYKQAVAQAANIQSTIDKKTIRAPFSGRLGIRRVNLGQTLRAGDPIVSLQAMDPIFADFYLPQQDLPLIGRGTPVRITSDGIRGRVVEGKITAINPDVDSATRNVLTEATLANPDGSLHPGMFANVEVVLPAGQKVLVIPATSILYAPFGDSVFVVEKGSDNAPQVVRQQFVRLGATRGDFVAVGGGLKAGDEVVSSGLFKLRNGETVSVDNSLAPPAQLAPKPGNS